MKSMDIRKIKYIDSTLRDGSHSIAHKLSLYDIAEYCRAIDGVGIDLVVVGHGNGLGASSRLIGKSLHADEELLQVARSNLKSTKLGVLVIPGFAKLSDIDKAIALGVDVFLVACHVTEVTVTKQFNEYIAAQNKEVIGILMMIHMATDEEIMNQIRILESYGVSSVILMDSAGATTHHRLKSLVKKIVTNSSIEIGFHGHNNLGLAVSNTITALELGASIVDATVRGLGAGAGNTQIEQVIALRQLQNLDNHIKLNDILRISDEIVTRINPSHSGVDGVSISSGLAGVFSGFKPKVIEASKLYDISPYKLFNDLGKQRVVAGQEDKIMETAKKLSESDE
jgi:4-hydroxy 2-oxovalerate aldolase